MIRLLTGDCRDQLATLPDRSVQTIVTSPPYYGLRVYNPDDPREIGREATPAAYVAALVAVFAECWRVLRDDGTLWLNLGDSYASGKVGNTNGIGGKSTLTTGTRMERRIEVEIAKGEKVTRAGSDLPDKNLLGMPWRVAFALQDAGWILRSDIIWSKPNPMPESVRDRPTRAHEYLFLFAKRPRYFYDATAISEAAEARPVDSWEDRKAAGAGSGSIVNGHNTSIAKGVGFSHTLGNGVTRNRRSVWTISTRPYAAAHFATMPEALVEPCILAGSAAQACETCGAAWARQHEQTGHVNKREPAHVPNNTVTKVDSTGWAPTSRATNRFAPACACETNTGAARSVVLDPFGGAGTVAKVAERFQRDSILIDLNPAYVELQEERTNGVQVEMQL